MANPAVTYTFVNGNVADASQVNQNFTDIINSLTDGTKSLNIDALTAAGAAVLNGPVTLGNAVGDAITVNGAFAGTGGDASATQRGLVTTAAQTFKGVKTYEDGVKLKNEAGQTALTYSRIDVVSFYIIDGAGNSSTGANCYVTRIGNVVTIQFPEKTLTNTGTDRFISTSSDGTTKSWPDWLTPTSVTAQSTCVSVKGTQFIPGVLSVSPSQVFIIYADCAGSTFGASNEAKGVFVCTVTYLLN